jgi:cytochrome b involved in lipid metabolism
MFIVDGKIYVKIDDNWFDLTEYNSHPGGLAILKKYHLKDATNEFNKIKGHNDENVYETLKKTEIKNKLLIIFLNLIK